MHFIEKEHWPKNFLMKLKLLTQAIMSLLLMVLEIIFNQLRDRKKIYEK